jgi:hypothetical protein
MMFSLVQANEGQDSHNDDDKANKVNDRIHGKNSFAVVMLQSLGVAVNYR